MFMWENDILTYTYCPALQIYSMHILTVWGSQVSVDWTLPPLTLLNVSVDHLTHL